MHTVAPAGVAIRLSGVEQSFDDLPVLEPLDLRVEPGQFVAIVGPSGCGKSTLLAILGGLARPTAGRVEIDGTQLRGAYEHLGFVFQKDLLLDWRSALDNVLLQAQLRGRRASGYRTRALELLHMAGLGGFAEAFPRELSGGMRQRVALCRALLHEPSLLLLDEPFGALDALTREQLNIDLSELLTATSTTTVLVTHSIDEAVFLADRVLVMSARPARVLADVPVPVARPRRQFPHGDSEFAAVAEQVRALLSDDHAIAGARR